MMPLFNIPSIVSLSHSVWRMGSRHVGRLTIGLACSSFRSMGMAGREAGPWMGPNTSPNSSTNVRYLSFHSGERSGPYEIFFRRSDMESEEGVVVAKSEVGICFVSWRTMWMVPSSRPSLRSMGYAESFVTKMRGSFAEMIASGARHMSDSNPENMRDPSVDPMWRSGTLATE